MNTQEAWKGYPAQWLERYLVAGNSIFTRVDAWVDTERLELSPSRNMWWGLSRHVWRLDD